MKIPKSLSDFQTYGTALILLKDICLSSLPLPSFSFLLKPLYPNEQYVTVLKFTLSAKKEPVNAAHQCIINVDPAKDFSASEDQNSYQLRWVVGQRGSQQRYSFL